MKKFLLTLFIALSSAAVFGQAVQIFHDGEKKPKVFANGAIEKVTFQPRFLGSTEYQQVYETLDGEFRFDKVDSVKFNLPHLVSYRQHYILPRDACWFYPRYSSSYSSVTISGINSHWDLTRPGYYYIKNPQDDNIPRTSEYKFCVGNLRVPFKVTVSDKYALPYCFVKFRNKDVVKKDSIRFSTNDCDPRVLSPEVGSLIFPNVAKNLSFTGSNYATINNPYLMVMGAQWHVDGDYNWKNTSISSMLKTRYDEEGNFIIDMPEYDGKCRQFKFSVGNEDFSTWQEYYIDQAPKTIHTAEEHMAALREFYDSTDGPNWTYQENWWSDKPIYRWDNLHDLWGAEPIVSNAVYFMNYGGRQYSGLHGTIPESFTTFLDDCVDIDLSGGALYGRVPEKLTNHPRWQQFGWSILEQSAWYGGGIDFHGINLRMKDEKIEYIDGTASTAYEALSRNKLSIIAYGAPDVVTGNILLGYANKGLAYIRTNPGFADDSREDILDEQAKYSSQLPNMIYCWHSWENGDLCRGMGVLGSIFLLDDKGNVVYYGCCDWDIPSEERNAPLVSILKEYLGEPEDHEPFVGPKAYTSTDYSQDGQVVKLQDATVGKGINVVFMGDGFVDTDVADETNYDEEMRKGMEYLFSTEPLKTLRNRFNVYMVRAVSPNRSDVEGGSLAIGGRQEAIESYFEKIGIDRATAHTCVIYNNANDFFNRGETGMIPEGGSIAYIEEGKASSIIVHEVAGHGIGKLLDEYIYAGFEDSHIQPGAEESFKEWIKTEYHDRGWGMNISATDDPELVPWAHFLKDERYKDEVGIYQGAWNWPEELWRSTDNSVMKEAGYLWFNAPSREAIYKQVMQLSEGDSWTYDYETFVAFDQEVMANARAAAKARGAAPKDNKIFIERAPQIVSDKFISVPQSKRKAPVAKQSPHLNIPKDKTLTPIDQYKGDIRKARTIYVEGARYVIE